MSGAGFRAGLVSQNCWKGETCVLLAGGGSLYKVVVPEGRGGRHYRFRAAVRVEGAGTAARLWVRSEGLVRQTADIAAGGWDYYQIEMEVPADGGKLAMGFVLSGSGRAWVEDASFVPVKEGQERPARRLKARVWHI